MKAGINSLEVDGLVDLVKDAYDEVHAYDENRKSVKRLLAWRITDAHHNGVTYRQMAERLGLSVERVRQLEGLP